MLADGELVLSLLLTGSAQMATAIWFGVFLGLSFAVAVVLRRPTLEGVAFGLLTVTAAADLALFVIRGQGMAVAWHLPATLVLAGLIALALRLWALPRPEHRSPATVLDLGSLALVALAFWAVRIIQVSPSTGLSSQLGWTPLYMKTSFAAGRFLLPGDFHFGIGPLDSLFYAVDMTGLVALAGGMGVTEFYPPYLASSILAIGVAVLLLLDALRGNRVAQLVFVLMLTLTVAVDTLVQVALLRHWGDNVLILGGAVMLSALTRRRGMLPALRTAATASVFLVLARHYGAVFAALTMAGAVGVAFVHDRRRTLAAWPAWLCMGGLLVAFAARDLGYFLHPEPYYPGSKLLAVSAGDWRFHLVGALHDWGVMTDGRFIPLHPRHWWLVGLVALVALRWRHIRRRPARLLLYLSPLVVMALPAVLHALTGYRSSSYSSKPYLVATLFGTYTPALVVHWLVGTRWRRLGDAVVRWGLRGVAVTVPLWVAAGSAFGVGPGTLLARIKDIYDVRIVDLGIAQALREASPDLPSQVASHPLMYFYCEPGMGLRNYIGGTLGQDVDFWGANVQDRLSAASDLPTVLAELGWPNLYLSTNATYGDFVSTSWQRFRPDPDRVADEPWVERVVRYHGAALVIVKKPGT